MRQRAGRTSLPDARAAAGTVAVPVRPTAGACSGSPTAASTPGGGPSPPRRSPSRAALFPPPRLAPWNRRSPSFQSLYAGRRDRQKKPASGHSRAGRRRDGPPRQRRPTQGQVGDPVPTRRGAIHRALNTASLHHDFLILEENVVPIDLVRIVFAT